MTGDMGMLGDLIARGRPEAALRPWPRAAVDAAGWRAATDLLAAGSATLLDLWGEPGTVHMALLDEAAGAVAVLGLACPDGRYPAVGAAHAPAIRLERALADLYGIVAHGLPDGRPWLDHGRWGVARPLGAATATEGSPAAYVFLPAEGEGLHQIPVGPVHAGVIEPGHFRFTANGETVVRLEERLGYVHKGIEGLLAGADLDRAWRLAGRVSGDSVVAYQFAFAEAAEAALGVEAPARGRWLRALAAEIERIANHLGDFGAICNDAAFAIMLAHCGALRERTLRAAEAAFGHRLMRDGVVPGGMARDLDRAGAAAIRDLVADVRRHFPPLVRLYDETPSLQDRTVATGALAPDLARRFGAGGFVGRASGRGFDARRLGSAAPYDGLAFEVPTRMEGDVNARVWIRIHEIEASLGLIEQILDGLPQGPTRTALPDAPASGMGEGMTLVEGFRGDVFAWLRLDGDGRVARCRLRDPSWFQWPLLEAVIEGNIGADFPLCNKSFNCSYSGHDL